MNITGIITEYNPFHNGHLYHLNSAKEKSNCDGIICIMSGNFTQRGEPALIDKWNRAEMAILNGVDLVIELPTYYSLSSAEFFAKGAVSILNSLNIVTNIFFGSECGDIESLTKIAKTLSFESLEFKEIIKKNLDLGLTFAKSREIALSSILNDENLNNILSSSNNILGIEYIKALINLNSKIKPLTFKREGSNYNDKDLNSIFSSATSIRESLKKNLPLNSLKEFMPNESLNILNKLNKLNYEFIFPNHMYLYIKYRLLLNNVKFDNLFEVKEGLENKFLKEIYSSENYEDFIFKIKSKRYTYTKISRILTQIFLCFDDYNHDELIKSEYLYARVLAFNKTGQKILKEIKKNSNIPIITKISKKINNPLLSLDIQATKSYSILSKSLNPLSDYLKMPIIKD